MLEPGICLWVRRYAETAEDEVEDLVALLSEVQHAFPAVTAVSCGAVLSNYQRHRVEEVRSLCPAGRRCL